MMNETNVGLLLLLLLLAVTSKNSCANLIASDDGMMDGAPANSSSPTVNGTMGGAPANMSGPIANGTTERAPANMSSPTANDMTEGVDLLTNTFTWIQEKMLSYNFNNFNEIMDNLENDINNLPGELAEDRIPILTVLYISQDRFTAARLVLEQAAFGLNYLCDNIIEIIDKNDASERLLRYITQKVFHQLGYFNDKLEDVMNRLKDINNQFSILETFIKDFNATLNSRAKEIKNNEKEILQIIENDQELLKQKENSDKLNDRNETLEEITLVVCITNLGDFCPLTVKVEHIPNYVFKIFSNEMVKWLNLKYKFDNQNRLKSNTERKKKLQSKIEEAQESISALLSNAVVINDYINTESVMITKRQINLKESILDHEDISIEVMESKLIDLKDRLIFLKNACTSFLNHATPEILLNP